MNSKRVDILIISYLSGNCTEDEVKELQNWIKASEDNFDYFEKHRYTWISSVQINNNPNFNTETALNQLMDAISGKPVTINSAEVEQVNRVPYFKVLMKYAAIFIMIFGMGIVTALLLLRKPNMNNPNALISFEIPIGSKGKTTLPDGTKVWLNAGSKLSYTYDYNNKSRVVHLEGEGYFDVITNPQKPFIVKAKNIDIKAFGTIFNVKAYREDKEVITTLVRGKVTIEGADVKNKNFTLMMKPGQCIKYISEIRKATGIDLQENTNRNAVSATLKPINQILKIDSVKTELFTSWKDERWIIENVTLLELLKELERKYGVLFKVNADEIKNYHFSGTIQNESIEQVLAILSYTLPLKYDINRNVIKLNVDLELQKKFMKML